MPAILQKHQLHQLVAQHMKISLGTGTNGQWPGRCVDRQQSVPDGHQGGLEVRSHEVLFGNFGFARNTFIKFRGGLPFHRFLKIFEKL
ncbi:MAG: hypothetical protein WCL38_00625 [Actinomycetota bacterium]